MDSRLISFLYFFNIKQDYYECHEYGEHLWLEMGRPIVLKGLIQSAVCLYHLHNGNLKGGYSMWQHAKKYIQDERPVYQEIDLDTLIIDIDDVFHRVPQELYSKIVPLETIRQLNLPTVIVHIVDKGIERLLQTWSPEPLD